jgi:hypothetical protein
MASYLITTSLSNLEITEAQSFAIVTSTGAVVNLLTLASDGNNISVNGYVGTITTPLFGSSIDNTVSIATSGLTNSISMTGAGNKINNGGSIIAVDNGNVAFGYSAVAIYEFGDTSAVDPRNYITNSGSIFTSNPDFFVPPQGPGLPGYTEMSYGVVVRNASDTILSNSGTISATYGHAIKLGSGSDTFRNTGTVFGSVELDEGNNVTYNSGAIYGDVFLGNGNNTLRSQTGEIFGTITAGNGTNSIFAPSNGGQIVTGSGADLALLWQNEGRQCDLGVLKSAVE